MIIFILTLSHVLFIDYYQGPKNSLQEFDFFSILRCYCQKEELVELISKIGVRRFDIFVAMNFLRIFSIIFQKMPQVFLDLRAAIF